MTRRGPLLGLLCLLAGCGGGEAPKPRGDAAALLDRCRRLVPLHQPLAEPQPGDWLAEHEEEGQTFAEYLAVDPVGLDGERQRIYVLPVGEFAPEQRRVLDLAVGFTRHCFGCDVVVQETLPLASIPDHARREFPAGGWLQLHTTYILQEVLRTNLPDDAAAYIAFCANDLWPGRGWNFVFGQASLRHRVGVWSIYRNGDPAAGDAAFRLCLLRTMKTATHEIGHMFGMAHCILFECNLCGSNHRQESDRKPLWLCSECLPKVIWATGVDPVDRCGQLARFCAEHGLESEASYYRQATELLR